MENNENKNIENNEEETDLTVEETPTEEITDEQTPERMSLAHSVFEWIELFVLAFTVVLLLMTFIGRHSPVVGESMLPTLEEGDVLIVSDIAYTPKNGDIIVCQSPWGQCETDAIGFNEPLVKRIIALGGQEVDIDFYTWSVYVDGEKVEIFKTFDALMAFDIAWAGAHIVELKYDPPIYKTGMIISVIGISTFAVICILDTVFYFTVIKKRRQKEYPVSKTPIYKQGFSYLHRICFVLWINCRALIFFALMQKSSLGRFLEYPRIRGCQTKC